MVENEQLKNYYFYETFSLNISCSESVIYSSFVVISRKKSIWGGILLRIEGAVACPPFKQLFNETREHGVDIILIKWIYRILMQRLQCAE